MNKIQYESIVRNLVVAYKVARQKNKQPAVILVYADSPGLPNSPKGQIPGMDGIHPNSAARPGAFACEFVSGNSHARASSKQT
jgi:hypothetical protein